MSVFRRILLTVLLVVSLPAAADPVEGYYATADGLRGQALKNALHDIVASHTMLAYSKLATDYYPQVYVTMGSTAKVWDIFSPDVYTYSSGGFAREHVVPNSWWGAAKDVGAWCDLFSVVPANAVANGQKSNNPPGKVAQAQWTNGRITVGSPAPGQGGESTNVFEPADDFKGDVARIYLYVATCYPDLEWEHDNGLSPFAQEDWPGIDSWLLALLLEWNALDPVSEMEVRINNSVERIQGNRNPFVDYPVLADCIWGGDAEEFSLSEAVLYRSADGTALLLPGYEGFTGDDQNVDDETLTSDEWRLVTDASSLALNDELIIASRTNDCAMGPQTENNRAQKAIVRHADGSVTPSDEVVVLALGAGKYDGTWCFWDDQQEKYLYAASSAKNYLRSQDQLTANSSWTISIASNGNATVTAQGDNSHNVLRYNSNPGIFACYASGQQDICLYRREPIVPCTVRWLSDGVEFMAQASSVGSLLALPSVHPAMEGYDFRGWTLAENVTEDGSDIIYAQTGDAMDGDMTWKAVFARLLPTGAPAPVGSVLWGESFGHFNHNTPSSAGMGNGTVTWADYVVTYSQTSHLTVTYDENPDYPNILAGGEAPELLLSKNSSWTIGGIPLAGARQMKLSFGSNKNTIAVTTSTPGIVVNGSGNEWTLDVSEECRTETFDLTIANTSASTNVRLDDLALVVKVAGEHSLEYGDYRLRRHSGICGDADDNGVVDVSDVTLTVAVILGSAIPAEDYSRSQMDVNGDGFIDVSDVTAIVNTILGNVVE